MEIGSVTEVSKAELYCQKKGWNIRVSGDQINVKDCPFCNRSDWKVYISRDSFLWKCHACNEAGNEFKLKAKLGDSLPNITSTQDAVYAQQKPEALPNVDGAHERLLTDDEAMEYLVATRGWAIDVIKRMKLGVVEHNFDGIMRKCLVFPYYVKDNLVFAKYRTLPPAEKDFRSTQGRDMPLFNQNAIAKGMDELIFVEGEADTMAMLSKGIEPTVGVPGADVNKKVNWLTAVDRAAPKQFYALFDNDTAGQKGAYELAIRLGIERVKNIVIPDEWVAEHNCPICDGTGDKEGSRCTCATKIKDINEWFKAGHTREEFEDLKTGAREFNVAGCTSALDALEELEHELEERGTVDPPYKTPWPSLNARLGGFEPGMLVGWTAEGKVGKTTLLLNLASYITTQYEEAVFFDCLEMTPKKLVRKLASFLTQTDDTPFKSQITVDTYKQTRDILRQRKGDLLFGYTRSNKMDDLFDTIVQVRRRYGIKHLVFDNLQLAVDTTIGKNIMHRVPIMSQTTKRFKQLAMELNIVVHLIMQPKRVKAGEVIGASDTEGSSAPEKDVDAMVCLHRQRLAKQNQREIEQMGTITGVDANFSPKLHCRVDLARYAPGGPCELWMDGGRSTVSEIPINEGGPVIPIGGINEITSTTIQGEAV